MNKIMCFLKDEYDAITNQWYVYYHCKLKKLTLAQLKSMPAPECRDNCNINK